MQQSVLDAFFCIGIVKCHMADSVEVQVENDQWIDPGTPFASNIALDNWVHDMTATKYSKVQFAGDWYRIPFDELDSPIFDQAAVRNLDLKPTTKYQFGDQNERLDRIASGQETDRDELVPMIDMVDVWVPRDKMIYTFPINPQRPFADPQKAIAAFPPDDPHLGPYDLLTFNPVPENVLPSSPASHISGMARNINNIMRKQSRKSQGEKDIFFYTPAGKQDAERIQNASDQQRVQLEDPQQCGVMHIGGVSQTAQAYLHDMLAFYDRSAGNLSTMAGLGNQAPTLGQEQMIQGNVSKKEASMQYRIVSHTVRIVRRLGRMLWNDQNKTIPGQMTVPGLEHFPPLEANWEPGDREGDYEDYDLNIDIFSMPHQSPQQKFNTMLGLLQNVFLPAGEMLKSQGGSINFQKVAESAAKLLNAPELTEWIEFSGMPTPLPGEGDDDGGGSDEFGKLGASTTRNYVRQSVSGGGSPQNQATMRQQAWLGMAGGEGGGGQGQQIQQPAMMGAG